jgi:hypothetical protein
MASGCPVVPMWHAKCPIGHFKCSSAPSLCVIWLSPTRFPPPGLRATAGSASRVAPITAPRGRDRVFGYRPPRWTSSLRRSDVPTQRLNQRSSLRERAIGGRFEGRVRPRTRLRRGLHGRCRGAPGRGRRHVTGIARRRPPLRRVRLRSWAADSMRAAHGKCGVPCRTRPATAGVAEITCGRPRCEH